MTEQAPAKVADFTFEVGERETVFVLNEELYPLDAIYGAAYLFLDSCFVFLSRPEELRVQVRLRTQQSATGDELEALGGRFANELLNQALRVRIGTATGPLREQYMARAFAPASGDSTIAKLLAELDAEELDEEPLEIAVPWETKHEDDGKPKGASGG